MAETALMEQVWQKPFRRILNIISLDKKDISAIYFYSIFNGLIQLSLPIGIQSIINFVLGGEFRTSLVVLIVLVVFGVFLNGLAQVNQMKLIEKIQQKIFVRYAHAFSSHMPKINLQQVDHYYLPELINRFFDTISLQKGIGKLLLDIPTATIQILFGLILLSFYHPVFIIFGLVLIAIVYFIIYFTASRGMETSLRESDYKYEVAGWLQEMARVIKSIKFSKGTDLPIRKTDKSATGYVKARTAHFKILMFQYWTLIGFKVMITAAMLIVGTILLINTELNIGQFIAAEIVILLVMNSVEKLIINLDKVYDVLTSVEKLGKVTDKKEEPQGSILFQAENKGIALKTIDLNFAYNGDDKVLKNINLDIKSGEKVLLMGYDGSGKSTLLRMFTGAYPEFYGSILINDVPIANYVLESIREHTGIYLSMQEIFHGTLLENITMGHAEISTKEILAIADKIGLSDFLQEQANGFDTMLDPTGKRLSNSVIQKILLLRAFVGNPKLLLMEEPWLGVTANHQQSIIDYIIHEMPFATALIASNEQNFAELFDKVIYLSDGKVVAAGKWNEIKNKVKP